MSYRFIRNGKKPVDQCYRTETELVGGFAACADSIKGRLAIFINSKLAKHITFRFKDYTVMVRKV